MEKLVNGKLIEETAEEISQREIDIANSKTKKAERQANKDLKVSAKEKLIAGEPLTAEEADTIVL